MSKRLPIGNHYVCIVSIETKDSAKGDGKNKVITLECIGDEYKGARHTLYWPITSADPHALAMARRREAEYISAACGADFERHSVRDIEGTVFRPFMLALEPSKAEWFSAKAMPCPAEHQIASEEACEALRKRLVPTAPKPGGGFDIITVSEVEAEEIDWLWPERFALGKLHIIAGEPGQGKSQFTLFMAAQTTNGGAWPNNEGSAPDGDVVILACEDDVADTMRPRLEAAGADLSRVHVAKAVAEGDGKRRGISLQTDLAKLEAVLARVDRLGRKVRLIIIDPVSAYMGDVDTHKEAAVRAVLEPVADFAARHDVAVVCVAHPPKVAAGGKAINAVTGAKAFVGASRAAWFIGPEFEKDDDGQRIETGRALFLLIKKNIGRKVSGLAYRVEEKDIPTKRGTTKAPYIRFETGEVAMSADDMLKPDTGSFGRKPLNKVEAAKAFLAVALKDGPVEQNQLVAKAKEAGIGYDTLNNARKALGIQSVTQGFQGLTMWAVFGWAPRPDQGPLFN
ncbi:MAG: AAA family ATPase [Alphaproteobacteria bacterium]|nr:AAA family ATPase [Alphaproteobacteria bacterium]